jgi:polar amino acid transport system substrate-binding protein
MKTPRWRYSGVLALSVCASALATDKPASMKMCYEDQNAYPWVMKDRPGLNILHLKVVEKKLGVKLCLYPLPWKRCQESLKDGVMDGIFAASFNPERMEIGVYPMVADEPDNTQAMMQESYSLYRLKGSAVQWDGKKLTVTGLVGAQPGYSIVRHLQQLGANVDEGARSVDSNLKKLMLRRVNAVALQTLEGDNFLRSNPEFADKIEKVGPKLVEKAYFLMLSKPFVAKYGDFAKELWKSVTDVREAADYKAKMTTCN